MSFLENHDDPPTNDELRDKLLALVSRKPQFALQMFDLGGQFFIKVVHEWDGAAEFAVDGKLTLGLVYMGPTMGPADIMTFKCTNMMDVLIYTEKLIDERNNLQWDERLGRWIF